MKRYQATLLTRAAKGVSVIVLSLTLSALALAQVYYVRAGASGDGSSWANAFGSIQDAINAAPPGSEIRVAQGVYGPINLNKTLSLKGGYAGTGANPDARDIGQYQTIIDGGNASRCITISDGINSLIEGFVIQNGRSTPSSPFDDAYGGGLYLSSGSPTIRYNWFRNNTVIATDNFQEVSGGAIFIYEGSPIIELNIFSFNTATSSYDSSGGAISIYTSNNAQIRNNLFVANTAAASGVFPNADGGAIWIYEGTGANIYNNTFVENHALINNAVLGGAVWAYEVPLQIKNNIFAGHQASSIYHYGGNDAQALVSKNCFFNPAVLDWEGSGINDAGDNLISVNPQFVDAENGDYRLSASSPCIDAGDSSVVDWSTDLFGNPRIQGSAVDIGAFEYTTGGGGPEGDVNGDGCVDDADLLIVLFNFGQTGSNPADVNGDSVVDDADLLIVLFNFGQGCGG